MEDDQRPTALAGLTLIARDRPQRIRFAYGDETLEVPSGSAVQVDADGEGSGHVYVPPDIPPTLKISMDDLVRGEFLEEAGLDVSDSDEDLRVAVDGARDLDVRELRRARERAAEAGRHLIVTLVERHGREG